MAIAEEDNGPVFPDALTPHKGMLKYLDLDVNGINQVSICFLVYMCETLTLCRCGCIYALL